MFATRTSHLVPAGLVFLAAGMTAGAVLGPLMLGVIEYPVSDSARNQLLGGELASLLMAAPAAVISAFLRVRGHPMAPALGIAPALYAVYMYVQYIAGPEYSRYDGNSEHAFPLFLALVVVGWLVAAGLARDLATATRPSIEGRLRIVVGITLVAVNGLFALAWLGSIAPVVGQGETTAAYRDDPTLFWLVRLMDLGFVIPAGLVFGIALLRGHSLAAVGAQAFIGVMTLLATAVCNMAWAMQLRDDPSASIPFLVGSSTLAIALIVLSALVLRNWQAGYSRSIHASHHAAIRPPTTDSTRFDTIS